MLKKNWLLLINYCVLLSIGILGHLRANTLKEYDKFIIEKFNEPKSYASLANLFYKNNYPGLSSFFIKAYLQNIQSVRTSKVEELISQVIEEVGLDEFELLDESILLKTSNYEFRYLIAKKRMKKGNYQKSYEVLRSVQNIPTSIKPFWFHLSAVVSHALGKNEEAMSDFNNCVKYSNQSMKLRVNQVKKKRLEINRDYCTMGLARVSFSQEKFEQSKSVYLDIQKESYVWPEILWEEAWSSFYLNEFNRTLGKLVTYNAPILDFIFIPQIDSLRALSYMEICLWDDAEKISDDFYTKYLKDYESLRKIFANDYKNFEKNANYLLSNNLSGLSNKMLIRIINRVKRDPIAQIMFERYESALNESKRIETLKGMRSYNIIRKNMNSYLSFKREIIGHYFTKRVVEMLRDLSESYEGMSYIKLEILARKKDELYNIDRSVLGQRGDLKNVKRNEKQLFWSFNSEYLNFC